MTIEKIQESWAVRTATTIATLLSGVAVIGAGLAWMFGGFNGIIIVQHDMINFGAQITELATKVTNLSLKIDQLPRQQDMAVVDRHLSALDARADGIEGRLRQVELGSNADHAVLEGIRSASGVALTPAERRR